MSVHISSRVWAHSRSRGSHRLVLLAIADMADSEGECYPGVAKLAEMVCLKPRQVQNILRDLEAAGELETAYQSSKWGTNVYRVTVAEGVQPSAPPRCNAVHPPGAAECTPPVQRSAPKPSVDPSVEPSVEPSERRTRAKRAVLTPSERQTLVEEFADLGDVAERIDAALNHRAVDKCKSEYLYVRNWLRRERQWATERGQRSGKPAKPTPVFPGVTDAYTDAFAVSLWIVRDGKDAWLLEHQEAIAAEAKRRGLSGTEEIMDMINGVVPA